MLKRLAVVIIALALAGCESGARPPVETRSPLETPTRPGVEVGRRSIADGVADYRRAAARVEPVAVAMCREIHPTRPARHCDFDFRLVDEPRIGPNAFQTLREDGRPLVAMTVQLVAETANADEIAFVLGHEAAHHIADHIAKSQTQAMTGALVLGTLAGLGNASEEVVNDMMRIGASLGGRAYSQAYELEADTLGTYIAAGAGFDPRRGALIFARPVMAGGGGLLSTHPPSAQRQAAVAATAARIGAGGAAPPRAASIGPFGL